VAGIGATRPRSFATFARCWHVRLTPKRPKSGHPEIDALCQQWTHASQQAVPLFDHLVRPMRQAGPVKDRGKRQRPPPSCQTDNQVADIVVRWMCRERSYDSRLAISTMYFSYSAREIRPPSRSTRTRSFAGKDVCTSSTRFHGASGVSHAERGTYSDGLTFL
jgi:hypothetical protein